MIIDCPNCNKKFDIDQNLVPAKGRLLQCGSCNYKWFFELKNKKENFDEEKKSPKNKLPVDNEIPVDSEIIIIYYIADSLKNSLFLLLFKL